MGKRKINITEVTSSSTGGRGSYIAPLQPGLRPFKKNVLAPFTDEVSKYDSPLLQYDSYDGKMDERIDQIKDIEKTAKKITDYIKHHPYSTFSDDDGNIINQYPKGKNKKGIVPVNEWIEITNNTIVESDIKTDPSKGIVSPSYKVISDVCEKEKFCKKQGPITFGQLRELVETAQTKNLVYDIGEGFYKALLRLIPWFFPQVAVAGFIGSTARAVNKIIRPGLEDTKGYKTWWGKTIMNVMDYIEGDLPHEDPISKIFFISDGLLHMLDRKFKLKFARYIAELAASKPDSEPVPEYFVENELRNWINQKFLIDPPLGPKKINEDLAVWFGTKKKPKGSSQPKGPWVNICRKKEGGGHPPCGRPEASDKGYPKCRAAGVASKMTDAQKRAACQQKRKVEKTHSKSGTGNKPKMVSYKPKKSSKNESLEGRIKSYLMEYLKNKG